jgi:hypothetical protein
MLICEHPKEDFALKGNRNLSKMWKADNKNAPSKIQVETWQKFSEKSFEIQWFFPETYKNMK